MEQVRTIIHNGHSFEPVQRVPYGYRVWNIGRRNFPFTRCIPLCKLGHNEYEWQRNIDTESLKYIIVPTEEVALKIISVAQKKTVHRKMFCELLEN